MIRALLTFGFVTRSVSLRCHVVSCPAFSVPPSSSSIYAATTSTGVKNNESRGTAIVPKLQLKGAHEKRRSTTVVPVSPPSEWATDTFDNKHSKRSGGVAVQPRVAPPLVRLDSALQCPDDVAELTPTDVALVSHSPDNFVNAFAERPHNTQAQALEKFQPGRPLVPRKRRQSWHSGGSDTAFGKHGLLPQQVAPLDSGQERGPGAAWPGVQVATGSPIEPRRRSMQLQQHTPGTSPADAPVVMLRVRRPSNLSFAASTVLSEHQAFADRSQAAGPSSHAPNEHLSSMSSFVAPRPSLSTFGLPRQPSMLQSSTPPLLAHNQGALAERVPGAVRSQRWASPAPTSNSGVQNLSHGHGPRHPGSVNSSPLLQLGRRHSFVESHAGSSPLVHAPSGLGHGSPHVSAGIVPDAARIGSIRTIGGRRLSMY